jgi:hypothetical protein
MAAHFVMFHHAPWQNIWSGAAIRHFISFENLSVTAIAFGV